jgi:LuxR family transcriptional regulator of csgAB operon
LQNSLLARHLEEQLQPGARVSTGADPVFADDVISLRDCLGFDSASLEESIRGAAAGGRVPGRQILFNVAPGTRLEEQALNAGFSGVFYATDSPDLLTRGIRAVLAGDLWFSREVSSQCIVERSSKLRTIQGHDSGNLTPRETEILGHLVLGASNGKIADKFFISPATVKTHVYRIYRKIGVRNRFQAILWATKNM